MSLVFRDLDSAADLQQVEELQKVVWGVGDRDVVPSHQLVAALEAGGLLVGALDGPTLAAFVYAFPSLSPSSGAGALHSHLLGVHPQYRRHRLGDRLKRLQRERALAKGLQEMTWTFDPLRTINAHFNLRKLGVISDRYIIDFYPEERDNILNRSGTDRLWVTWRLTAPRVVERLAGVAANGQALEHAERLLRVSEQGRPVMSNAELTAERVAIEILEAVLDGPDVGLMDHWRGATRDAFTNALAAGYVVEDFYRAAPGRPLGTYLLIHRGDRGE